MEGNILVTTQELLNASSEFQTRNNSITQLTGQMLSLAKGLNSQWEGDSATEFINRFGELEDDMGMISKMITEHVKDLEEMAKVYGDTDFRITENVVAVNTNLIS